MIGQNIGLMFFVPLALEKLADDPLAEGHCYPGDLLCNLLSADTNFWRQQTDLKSKLDEIITHLAEIPESVDESIAERVHKRIHESIHEFRRRIP